MSLLGGRSSVLSRGMPTRSYEAKRSLLLGHCQEIREVWRLLEERWGYMHPVSKIMRGALNFLTRWRKHRTPKGAYGAGERWAAGARRSIYRSEQGALNNSGRVPNQEGGPRASDCDRSPEAGAGVLRLTFQDTCRMRQAEAGTA